MFMRNLLNMRCHVYGHCHNNYHKTYTSLSTENMLAFKNNDKNHGKGQN